MPAERQVREIIVKVDAGKSSSDLKNIAVSMGGLNKSVKEASSSIGSLKNLFQGLFAASIFGFGAREIIGFSDSMQQLNDRIRILSPNAESADAAFKGLLNTANETKTSVDGLATVYSRLAASTSETGISTRGLLDLTKLLQNSFRLSGATTQEAVATSVQLSQAFASGQVRGQELRSVLEQNVVVAKLLRKEYGADIYEKAAKGAISAADVLRILFKAQTEINDSAKQLGQTFEQTLTVALNDFKFAIFELNKEFDLSGKFATGIQFITEKLGLLASVAAIAAATAIPALVAALQRVGVAAFAAFGPVGLVLGAITLAITYFIKDLQQFQDILIDIFIEINKAVIYALNLIQAYSKTSLALLIPGLASAGQLSKTAADSLKGFNDELQRGRDIQRTQDRQFGPSKDEFLAESKKAAEQKKFLASLEGKNKVATLKEQFADLNKEFLRGKVSAEDYFSQINTLNIKKVTEDFEKGKISLDQYNDRMSNLKKIQINKAFNEATISLSEFQTLTRDGAIANLNQELQTGKINLIEYNRELVNISDTVSPSGTLAVGAANYLDSIGTTASQVAKAIEGTFSGLEDALVEFTQNGTLNFKKFAQGVLDDLTRIIIRSQIIAPLANGLLNFGLGGGSDVSGSLGSTSGSLAQSGFAKGGVFNKGLQKFASGGVVSSPTLFGYGNGQTGMMGEAGAEAILPLSRGSNGNLGVQSTTSPVIVNVINNTDASTEQRESTGPSGERILEVIITRKVQDGIASGTFDKSFAQSYGLRRKG